MSRWSVSAWRWFVMVLAATVAFAVPARAEDADIYVNYAFSERVRTPEDHREIRTEFYLSHGFLNCRHTEWVSGAITPTVTEIGYSDDVSVPVTPAQQARLIADLRVTGIFSLKDDPAVDVWSYFARLYVATDGEKHDLYFNTPPTGSQRAAAHKILLDFIGQWCPAPSPGNERGRRVSEGDRVAARQVTLAQLVADPEAWDGKRVTLTGYVHLEFEGDSICAHAPQANVEPCLWYGGPSDFADGADLTGQNDSWQRVEGIFVKGPGGHMGMYPGEIQRITLTQTVTGP